MKLKKLKKDVEEISGRLKSGVVGVQLSLRSRNLAGSSLLPAGAPFRFELVLILAERNNTI